MGGCTIIKEGKSAREASARLTEELRRSKIRFRNTLTIDAQTVPEYDEEKHQWWCGVHLHT